MKTMRGHLLVSKISKDAKKKERERRIIEVARQRSGYFPQGELFPSESPDWLIPSASLGIEVSELLPRKAAGARFSGPQVSSFQESVILVAQQSYYSIPDVPPADVLVFCENDWNRKRDVKEMGHALARFVRSNYPSGAKDCITFQSVSSEVRDWVDGLSVVRILRGKGDWQAGGAGDISFVTFSELAERIAGKNLRLPDYRRHWPGWEMWLLLSTRMTVLHSVLIPDEITAWQFNTGFDKVLLSPWDSGVLELHRLPH
jgi:hypothetical protein